MDDETEMIVIGALTGQPLIINQGDLIYKAKKIRGLILPKFLMPLSHDER